MSFLFTATGVAPAYKRPVRAASTAPLSSLSGSGALSIDGVTLVDKDRVLLKDQGTAPVSDASQNGIYVVSIVGANWSLVRATDANASHEIIPGMIVPVAEGSTQADEYYQLTTDAPITVGTTALTFVDILQAIDDATPNNVPSTIVKRDASGNFATQGIQLDSLTASRILSSDGSKNIAALDTATYPSLTELSYVKGVTSGLQSQIDGKASRSLNNLTSTSINQSLLFSDDVSFNIGAAAASRPQNLYVKSSINLSALTADRILSSDASKNIVSLDTTTYQSLTELSYVKGVTSALQTQLNAKVDSVSGSAPISSSGGVTPTVSISKATALVDGYLSKEDWATFNAKQNALTFGNLTSSDLSVSGGTGAVIGSGVSLSLAKGNLTESTSSVLTISSGTNAVLGSGTTIEVKRSDASTSGYLHKDDFAVFNNKQPAGSYITALTGEVTASGPGSVAATIANSAVTNAKLANMAANTIKGNNTAGPSDPLDLSVAQTTAMLNAFVGDSGAGGTKGMVPAPAIGDSSKYLKGDGSWSTVTSGVTSVTASSPLASSGGATPDISISQASALSGGYLSSTDWSTFNSKENALTFSAPLSRAVNTISIPVATSLANGYLSSTDWSTFNSKMSNPMTTAGDIIVGGASGTPGRLALGTVDKVLVSDGTTVSYQYAGLGGGSLGTNNVVLGRSKPASLSGTANTIVGAGTTANALAGGTGNTIMGHRSGEVISTGNYNIAIGVETGKNITTGSNNLMMGYLTGDGVSTNSNNTLVGHGAGGGVNNYNHSESTMLGSQVNFYGQACNNSVFIGFKAANVARSANHVVIGSSAAIALTTGSDTIAIGRDSARVLTTGGSNTVLGSGAAYTNLTTGARNTLLGSETDTLATSTADSISLGHRAKSASNEFAVGSSTSVINTMLLGRGGEAQTVANAVTIQTMRASGTSNTSMTAGTLTLGGAQGTGTGAGGDVIIATAPANASGSTTNAHVERIRAKSATEVVVNDTGVDFDFRVEGDTDANLLMVDAGADKVGIGTATPSEKLEVNGNIKGGTISFNADSNRTGTVSNLGFKSNTITHDFGSISHGNSAEVTITVSGAAVGDAVFVGPPAAPEIELGWSAYVSAADTVTLRVYNTHNSNSVDPASATWRVTVLKS